MDRDGPGIRRLMPRGFIAGVYTIRQLVAANDFNDRVAAAFVDYWVSKQIFNDVTLVQEGPKTQAFRRLPDGTFNSPAGSSDALQQIGSKASAVHGGWMPDYDYSSVTFKLTKADGSILSFDWSTRIFPYGWDNYLTGYDGTFEQPFIAPKFKVDSWAFPDGQKVSFNYTLISASTNLLSQGNVIPGRMNTSSRLFPTH